MTLSPAGQEGALTPPRLPPGPVRPTAASAPAAPQSLRPCPEGALPGRGGDPRRDPAPSAPRRPPRPLPERAALLTGARAGGCRGRPAAGDRRPQPLRGRAVLAPPSCSGAWAPTARAAADAAAAATPPPARPAVAGAGLRRGWGGAGAGRSGARRLRQGKRSARSLRGEVPLLRERSAKAERTILRDDSHQRRELSVPR